MDGGEQVINTSKKEWFLSIGTYLLQYVSHRMNSFQLEHHSDLVHCLFGWVQYSLNIINMYAHHFQPSNNATCFVKAGFMIWLSTKLSLLCGLWIWELWFTSVESLRLQEVVPLNERYMLPTTLIRFAWQWAKCESLCPALITYQLKQGSHNVRRLSGLLC